MVLLSNDEFLSCLHELMLRSKEKGSVYLTMKRCNLLNLCIFPSAGANTNPNISLDAYKQLKSAKKSEDAKSILHSKDTQYQTLMRATFGNKKLSTLVDSSNLVQFTDKYQTVTRLHMDSLKKKDRKDKKEKRKNKNESTNAVVA
ncbi:hypothetical protein BATDEDRAFT_88433 [Batrachochytrium dendrobatidis JAM81]|uniref:Signal recognition particle subunit SRP14 n=1 Tax=Batrachochytrium dendrobatidis (strain JAM81 / FGSC 10211) TaxID=684364 RepID=F4P201_BATDJ|nr:uncharacterized protein BATDEDRAFT_88433 [Batrachochytrium dendrobatidis JAM81]EGF80775.1 hypothetical protein BATDEDRAFT_88433 [Batrachochytrium dendrobatidis JAM81]|eukprot:XP_006678695.1 hypothetical protein BATDEDRAFT_88433 [Batrachochytrium dendrobatidis JAM81]